jgi:cell division protein FtsI (penicillin-binding protein 3)
MGHEVGATSIQLAQAGAVIANGGLLVKPRLVLARQKPAAAAEPLPQEKPQRVIAPETAIKMRQMMEGVVLRGTGKQAILRGYTSGGKTGSAQIYDFKTRAYTHSYNASFLGFAPVANPQIVIAVTLIGTSGAGAGFGGATAAPVFREVAMSALRMLDVPKDLPESAIRTASVEPPDSENDLAIAGLGTPPELFAETRVEPSPASLTFDSKSEFTRPQPASSSAAGRPEVVSSVTPPPVQGAVSASANAASPDRRPFLSARADGPRVPDFRGMTLNTVLEESAATGLPVEVLGSGLARNQDPPPGSVLPPGTRIRVQFAR